MGPWFASFFFVGYTFPFGTHTAYNARIDPYFVSICKHHSSSKTDTAEGGCIADRVAVPFWGGGIMRGGVIYICVLKCSDITHLCVIRSDAQVVVLWAVVGHRFIG